MKCLRRAGFSQSSRDTERHHPPSLPQKHFLAVFVE